MKRQQADAILVLGRGGVSRPPFPGPQSAARPCAHPLPGAGADSVITTGGAGGDPDFTEGGVGRSYLIEHDVPTEAIIVEPEGETTAHSIAAAGEIMDRMGLKSCVLVSDGYHIYRAKKMLESRGITVYGLPRPSNPRVICRSGGFISGRRWVICCGLWDCPDKFRITLKVKSQ